MTHDVIVPQAIEFNCDIVSGDFRAVVGSAIDCLGRLGLAPAGSWRSDRTTTVSKQHAAADLADFPDSAEHPRAAAAFALFDLGEAGVANAAFHPDWHKPGLIRFSLGSAEKRSQADDLLAFQAICLQFLIETFDRHYVYSADLTAIGGGALCIPDVALVTTNSHIAVTNAKEVDDHYDDPAAFWNAGWTIAAKHKAQRLLTREMNLLAGPAYLAAIIDQQWAMARAAKAGETGYADPEILPEEENVYRRGPARLKLVSDNAKDCVIEYSCTLGKDQHIQGWEIFALHKIIETGQTPEGDAPVTSVRVIFPEQWMAESEKRPLLDVGCDVLWLDGDGTLRQVDP